MRQLSLFFTEINTPNGSNRKAIEDGFPIGFVSKLAEHESWRKEIYRPTYYIHKWWARRLGSVFRAILLSSCFDESEDIQKIFYKPNQLSNVTIFDPFMGSGTTIGEAIKLGCRVIGRDINPVSYFMVNTAIQEYSRKDIEAIYRQLELTIGKELKSFYKTTSPEGKEADVLYYFWVKTVQCPNCEKEVDLFKSRVFAQNATPKKNPSAKAICPHCSQINDIYYDQDQAACSLCGYSYNPQKGVFQSDKVTCPECNHQFRLIDLLRTRKDPLSHRMYAKLILTQEGKKIYLPIDENDQTSYEKAEKILSNHWGDVPNIGIAQGYNTKQVINYNYHFWYQMFNARQLACLTLLSDEIRNIPDPKSKQLFACLFSGMLEFNNMFCSYKGEGTGAVRHMFAHHILKPEMTPLEANIWGTSKSSGSFSTLYQSRILRALDYKDDPSEFTISGSKSIREELGSKQIFGLSFPINRAVANSFIEFQENDSVYLTCGDSSQTDIGSETVDVIVTDPPFFDNVHYSELADFFYVWIRKIMGETGIYFPMTTRSGNEVQNVDTTKFTSNLTSVFSECTRVLKKNGLMIFTYHHSQSDGWASVYRAIHEAGFKIIKAHPVKAEMSVAIPIQKAKTPINFDLIFVCKKNEGHQIQEISLDRLLWDIRADTISALNELRRVQVTYGVGDVKLILMGNFLSQLSIVGQLDLEIGMIYQANSKLDEMANSIFIDMQS